MISLRLTKIKSKEAARVPHIVGQLLYCEDSKQCLFDHEDGTRYSDMEENVVIGDTLDDFNKSNPNNDKKFYYMNKVYVTLSDSKFYKYNFDLLQFELIYTDDQFLDIVSKCVGLVPATMKDKGKDIAPVGLASNVYYRLDGTTTLDEMLNKELYITTTKVKYVEATLNGQRVFKIPFPVAKYSLYRDHMHVVTPLAEIPFLTPADYKVNNGYLVINADKPGIPKGKKIYFMFYYTRTTNTSESKVIGTDNLMEGCITSELLSPYIEIPAANILQEDNLQFMTQEEKELIQSWKDFKITEIDADIIVENADRKFVTETMYELLDALLNSDDDDDTDDDITAGIKYVHPDTHPASMIILRDLNKDVEQFANELDKKVLPNKWNIYDGNIETSVNAVFKPGNYTVLLSGLEGLPVDGFGNLHVETSTGVEFSGIDNTWVTQKFVYNDNTDEDNPKVRIFVRICNNKKKKWGEWSELLASNNSSDQLKTTAKDFIGAINEVFQLANDVKAKWQNVIGYPLDNYDTVANLYEKTVNIKKRLSDILTGSGIQCDYQDTLQNLVNLTPRIGDNAKYRTGLIRSSIDTIPFIDDNDNSFNEYYIEVADLAVPIGIINVYSPDGKLHCSMRKDKTGIYSIGTHNNIFKESENGAYIGSGFRLPVEDSDSNYRYYVIPISTTE